MATKIKVLIVDDLDGSEAEETVSFSFDGATYEIDLSSKNADKLRKHLAPYIESARRSSGGGGSRRRRRIQSAARRQQSADIRAWAKQQGLRVNERGRIPTSIVEGYESSLGKISPQPGSEIVIDIYLDTDDEVVASTVFAAVDGLAQIIGIEEMAPGELLHGSIFRRTKATIQASLSDQAVQRRLQTIERAIELWQVDSRQSEVDQRTSEALTRLINSLETMTQACIRFGSLLIVKYQSPSGPALFCRQLSQPEILAFEKYPELQKHPESVLDRLALALSRKNGLINDEPEGST